MDDKTFADALLNAAESTFSRPGTDFYQLWKTLATVAKTLPSLFNGRCSRGKARRIILTFGSKLTDEEKAQILAFVSVLPELLNYALEEIGRPDCGGRNAISAEDREAIKSQFEQKKSQGMMPTEAVRAIASDHTISPNAVWKILAENKTDAVYWVREIRRKIRLLKSPPIYSPPDHSPRIQEETEATELPGVK